MVLGVATDASAQEPTEAYGLAPLQPGTIIGVWGGLPRDAGTAALAGAVQACPPLRLSQPDGSQAQELGTQAGFELLGTVGVLEGLDVSAGAGMQRGWANAEASVQSRLGSARVVPRLRLSGDANGGVALLVAATAPLASHWSEQLRVEPQLALSFVHDRAIASANVGYRLHPRERGWGSDANNALTWGAGVELPFATSWSALMELAGQWSAHARHLEPGARTPTEARAGVRFTVSGWAAQLAAGTGLLGGVAEPDWRLMAALSFSPASLPKPPEHDDWADQDGDEIPDQFDRCPTQPEDLDGVRDLDGCPDVTDDDEDTVANLDDRCPGESEDLDGFEDDDGCPEPGPVAAAPPPAVVTESEPAPEKPREPPLPEISDVLYFEANQMGLDRAQRVKLDGIALELLLGASDVHLVIEGHSDDSGPPEFNDVLSRWRASAVRAYLIERGVPWQRLSIVGYGASMPVGSSLDAEGRARNRRVEFRVIRRKQP